MKIGSLKNVVTSKKVTLPSSLYRSKESFKSVAKMLVTCTSDGCHFGRKNDRAKKGFGGLLNDRRVSLFLNFKNMIRGRTDGFELVLNNRRIFRYNDNIYIHTHKRVIHLFSSISRRV